MRRIIPAWIALILALSFATIARAQGTGRLVGEVLDLNGKPYPDVKWRSKILTQDKHTPPKRTRADSFTQLGLLSGVYEIIA